MSSSPFSVDMETMEGHVPSTSEFITPRISGKQHPQQFQPNGLTGINELDVNTQKDKKMNVIVYCQPAKSSAEILQDEIQQGGHSASLLCLTEPKDLKEKIQLESVRDLYMMADSSLFELLFQKRHHRGFHSDVNDFMDELEDNKKCISLFNRMEEGDNRFMKLLNQFPTNCARKMERASISIDSGIADLSLNESSSQDSGGEAADSINKLKESSSSDSIKTGPGGDGREIYYSEKNACLMSSTPEGLIASPGNAESYSEESPGGEAEVKSKDEGALKLTEDESLSEDFEEEPQSNVDVHAVQIGNNNTMELLWTGSWMVSASQDGWNNTMGVKIVPPASKSNVNVTLTKNPRDEKLENLLVKVFNEESELVNIRVENLDASNVTFSRGSIVMEIEVKPGVTINKQYIEKLMNVIFSGKAGKVIPEGTKFDVDIQTKMVIPVDQLGKYVHLNPEKIHENCVSKEKYEEKVKEIQQLQSRLVQGILKNPKQDQVLQNALINFISSVLTDFAFAMATEIPALQVSGSRRQEATAREEERNPSDAAAPPPLPARRPPPAPPSQTQSHPVHVTKLNAAEESDEDDSYEEPPTARLNDSQEIYDDFEGEELPPISPYNPRQEAPQEIYDDFEEEQHGEIYEDAEDCGPEVTVLSPPSQAPPLPSMEGRRRGSQPPLPPVPSNKKDLPPAPVQDIYETTEDLEIDEDEPDEEAPIPPPLPSGRPKPPPPQRKAEEKKAPAVPKIGLGPIGKADIQGVLKGLRKVSREEKTEDKNNNDKKKVQSESLPFPVQLKKTTIEDKSKESQKENSSSTSVSGLRAKFTQNLKPTNLKDKKVVTPSQDKKGPPFPPRPVNDTHREKSSSLNESKVLQPKLPPPSPVEDFPPPPPPEEFDPEDIYDDAFSQDLDPLSKFPWYHGKVERKDCDTMLRNIGTDGSFLVRKSKQGYKHLYTMAVLYQDRVNYLKVRRRDDGRIALGDPKDNEISFTDVEGMVEHHKKHPVLLIGRQNGEITLAEYPKK